MDVTQNAVVMFFGALIAVAGLILLFLRKEQAENVIRIFGQEFRISTPALVVFLVGCFIFILPLVIQVPNQTILSLRWPGRPPSPGPVIVHQEEKEPNNEITAANLITMGTTVKGMVANKEDRDFFKFKTGQGLKTRVILRKLSVGGFWTEITVYDNVESRVDHASASGEDPVSFAFQSNPNSYYYAKVEGEAGLYELVIKEE